MTVIVAGHVIVERERRDDYLSGCAAVVEQARAAPAASTSTSPPNVA